MLDLIQREFIVTIPLSTAWKHLAQVEPWPTWVRHINYVELQPKGELTSGTAGSFHLANGVKSAFKMTEINPSRNWKWVGPFLWLMVHYDHKFEKLDEQSTKLIWTVSADYTSTSLKTCACRICNSTNFV